MSFFLSSRSKICSLTCWFSLGSISGLVGAELVLEKVPTITVEQVPAYPENPTGHYFGGQVEAAAQSNPIANLQLNSRSEDTNTTGVALLCDDPIAGYALPKGSTTLLVSFPKIENLDSISFLNHGTKGDVNIAIANAKLPADSPQWRNVSQQALTSDAVKARIGPTEAKYVRLTFNVAEPGRIAGLGIYKTASLIVANISSANREGIASDGKTVQDGKDFAEAKDFKEILAEAPAEGPPITLPQPPPFTFVPEVSF
jgi:hypothetical protein